MDPVDIAANGESATLDLTVRENEEVNPETLVLDAEVAGDRTYGRKTRATCRWPSRTPPKGSALVASVPAGFHFRVVRRSEQLPLA